MRKTWLTPAVLICTGLGMGCAATVVHKDPGPHDRGVRFYRPKPYLLVQPLPESETRPDKDGKPVVSVSTLSDRHVTMKLEWLPDFTEEYSIVARAGIGKNDTSFKLENGWNLTELNMKLDTRLPENIEAVAKLVTAVNPAGGGAKATGAGGGGAPGAAATVVAASNVPLGYYEAVLSRAADGKKRLYGWRYVGFMPYAACPVEATGLECLPCDAGKVYGLGFENGVMTFRELGGMAHVPGGKLQPELSGPDVPGVVQGVMGLFGYERGTNYTFTYGVTGSAVKVDLVMLGLPAGVMYNKTGIVGRIKTQVTLAYGGAQADVEVNVDDSRLVTTPAPKP